MRETLIRRHLCPQGEWEELSDNEYARMSGIFPDRLPGIDQLLRETANSFPSWTGYGAYVLGRADPRRSTRSRREHRNYREPKTL